MALVYGDVFDIISSVKISIIALGEIKNKNILSIEGEYLKRLRPLLKVETLDIPVRKLASLSEDERKKKEAELLLSKINKDSYLILLDENGISVNTSKFASMLKKHMLDSTKHVVFAIGGVYGWHTDIKKKADLLLSLSPLTYTYEFARIILTEQIYRTATLINGIPYHKE